MKQRVWMAIACVGAMLGGVMVDVVRADAVRRPNLVVPRLERAPAIDGVMDEGEWDDAAAVTGFIGATGGFGKVMVPSRNARFYIGHDDEKIYVGVWMELVPGEKPSMRHRRRDAQVYMDRHQFELWFTPPTDGHVSAYQMIGNAYGALYDMQHIPSLGIQNLAWDATVEFENNYKTGEYWTAELAFPIAELVDPNHYNPEKPWGLMVGVAWPQRAWPYTHGWYSNIDTHAQMWLESSGTVARLTDLTSLFDNVLKPELEIVNADATERVFAFRATRDETTYETTVTIPAGERGRVSMEEVLPEASERVNPIMLSVTAAEGRPLLDGEWAYRPVAPADREADPIEEKPWAMQLRLSHAALNMGAHCLVDVLDAPMRDAIDHAIFQMLDAEGEVIAVDTAFEKGVESIVDSVFSYDEAEAYLWLPRDLPYGTYTVTARFIDAGGNVLESTSQTLEHRDFADEFVWLNPEHQYGMNLTAAHPYTPLAQDGDAFEVWGRRYEMHGALPARMRSQNRELLARPVRFVAEIDGGQVVAEVVDGFSVVEADENQATFRGSYAVAGMKLELTGKILFDGGIEYALDATPLDGAVPVAVDRLYLSVPVAAAIADYMWTTPGGMSSRHYFMADLPSEGVIWTSREVTDFVPYLGISDDDRAIQWFADNDHDWIRGDDFPSVQVVRAGDEVEMQINLVRRAMQGERFAATFGLIATPIKPMPDGWRNTILHNSNITDSKVPFFFGPGHGKVGPFHWHDSAALAAANNIAIPEGQSADAVLAAHSGDGYPDLEAIAATMDRDTVYRIRGGLRAYDEPKAVKWSYFHNAKMYFEGNNAKAFRQFFPGDWTEMPRGGWFHLRPIKSYQDFFLFHLAQFAKFWAVPGMYYDETYFGRDYNVFNGQGRLMPDGSIRPSIGLTLQRQFLYRSRQVLLDAGIPPFIWVHTSEQMAPYSIGATDIAMFGENNTATPMQDIMDNIGERYMRSIGRAQKFGFVPVWMTMAGRGGPNWALPGRQTFGWCWLHDTIPEVHTHVRGWPLAFYRKQWGIDEADVQFHGYWQPGDFVSVNNDQYRVSYWTRPHPDKADAHKVLMMVMNMHYEGDDHRTVELTLDPASLGLPEAWTVYNLESMPDYVAREDQLNALDVEGNKGFGRVARSPQDLLGRDRLFWTDGEPYQLDALEAVSRGDTRFTIDVRERNFLTLIIE